MISTSVIATPEILLFSSPSSLAVKYASTAKLVDWRW